jgi:glycosyltransferase involved in cell wall biosynthesis
MDNWKEQKIVYTSTSSDAGGYSYAAKKFMRGLVDRGWDLKHEMIPGTQDISDSEMSFLNSLRLFDEHGKGIPIMDPNVIKIVMHLPLKNIPRYKHNVIYTMMESLKVNKYFIANCNRFYQTCWTPTEYNSRVFKECGMEIPVRVLPIGIDEIFRDKNAIIEDFKMNYKLYGPEGSPPEPQGFKFLSVFRWSHRKGPDVLIKAFLREFKRSDNVSLCLKTTHAAMSHDPRFYEYVQNDIQRIINECGAGNDSPPIYWCQDIIPLEFLPSMYNNFNCFCSGSRGEGFGIPMLEASYVGLPCILPKHSAFLDYVSEENCYPYEVDKWVLCNNESEWRRGGWITGDFNGQMFPKFGDTVIENVGYLMRHIKNNYEEAKQKNIKLQELINERYNWNRCLNLLEEYLREIIQ